MKHTRAALALGVGLMMSSAAVLAQSKTVVFCMGAPTETFDPARALTLASFNASTTPMYDKLVEWTETANGRDVKGELAESWTVSPDGTQYTFKLRPGVKFHTVDGFKPTRDMNAEDVVFTFKRLLDPEMPFAKAYGMKYPYLKSMIAGVKNVEAVDPMTVRFTLGAPNATFLPNLASAPQTIMSAEYADLVLKENRVEDFAAKPVGTGPFVFRRHDKDAQIRYDANPNYWGGKPKFDRYVITIQRDSAVRLQKMKTGECHIGWPPKPTEVEAFVADPNLRISEATGYNTGVVAINQRVKPLDNRDLRQAMSLATNRKLAVETVFGGQAQIANSLVPGSILGGGKQPAFVYDLEEARKLVAKAGVSTPLEFEVIFPQATPVYMPDGRRMGEIMQADFAKIGINLKLTALENGEFLKRIVTGNYQIALAGWNSDNGDPDNYFSNIVACKVPTNITGYCTQEIDDLITKGRQSQSTAERAKIYEQLNAIHRREMLHIPVAHAALKMPFRKEISGFRANPTGVINLQGVELK